MKAKAAHASAPSRATVPAQRSRQSGAVSRDRLVLRMAAVAGVAGIVLQVVMDQLHPAQAPPNDSAAAFREYAASGSWTYVHIGQYLGTLLIVLSLLALARRLAPQAGLAGALALVGAVTAVMVAIIFTVQMAVDGVALGNAVHTWVAAAPGVGRTAAFQVAEGLRSLEKGLSGFFHLSNGFTLLALGLSLALGRVYPRWLGWVGAVAGVAFLVGGVITARTGFSPEAGLFLTPALVLFAIFLVGACISMWRDDARALTG